MMSGEYLVEYTVYNPLYFNGFHSYYRYFDDLENLKIFINSINLKNSCIVYKKVDLYENKKNN